MFGNLFGTLLSKVIGVGIAVVLLGGGALYAGCSIKSCVRAEDRAATAEKTLEKQQEVQEKDRVTGEQIKEMTDEELLDLARTGNIPERLRHPRR